MSERLLSLTDVTNGMFRIDLHILLTPSCFRFFWALIMTANNLNPRFKNPFDLTAKQAIAAGGGESRQAVNQKQKTLRKIKINGKYLIRIKAGSKINNRPASYDINYNLLVPPSLYVPVFEEQPSKSVDDSLDDALDGDDDGILDGSLSILRSDQKREEKTSPHSTSNKLTIQKPEKPQPKDKDKKRWLSLLAQFQKADMHFKIVNDVQRDKMIGLLEYPDAQIETVLYRAAEKGVQGAALIKWAEKGLLDFESFYEGKSGLTYNKRDEIERELKELERDLADTLKMDDKRNAPWIEQTRGKIERCRGALGRI